MQGNPEFTVKQCRQSGFVFLYSGKHCFDSVKRQLRLLSCKHSTQQIRARLLSWLICSLNTISHRTPINHLLVNLAAADICYATFIIPTIILSHNVGHPEGVTGTVLCTIITGGNLAWIGGHASMVTLLVIAVERYSAVIYPYGNRGKLTFSRLKVCQFTIRQASNFKKVRPSQLKCK